jgi:simple sugar transport system permease protein
VTEQQDSPPSTRPDGTADAAAEASPSRRSLLTPRLVGAVVDDVAVPCLAVLTALVFGGVLIALAGRDPFLAYEALWDGAIGSPRALSETLVWATPYLFTGLAVALAFQAGLFNIGAEGQLAVGALAAAWLGYALPDVIGVPLPLALHLPLAVLGGALAGALWGAIPGWLKARTGAHEVINTIMLNHVALLGVSYLLNGPLRDRSPLNVIARTPEIALSARLPSLQPDLRVHAGLLLALLAVAAVAWLVYRTPLGFAIRTVGANPDAARYAGMPVAGLLVVTFALSGGLAGLAGAVEVTGLHHRHELGFSLGYGFDAIAIALLARAHPLGVVPAALLLGGLRNGAARMQFLANVPMDLITVLEGLILLFVAAEVLVRRLYRLRPAGPPLVFTRGWR